MRWFQNHSLLADVIYACVVGAVSVASHWFNQATSTNAAEPSFFGTVLVLLATLPIAFRRRFPIHVLAFITSAQFLAEVIQIEGSGWVGVLIAVYSVAAHTNGTRRVHALLAFGCACVSLIIVGYVRGELPLGGVISTVVFLVGAFILGDNLQRRRQHVMDLGERAERAERERDLTARHKVQDERNRIARDLHDVVAHSVSVMVIQSAAARRSINTDPAQAVQTLIELEATGRQAMNELRNVLGVLRSEQPVGDEPDLVPQPSLADVRSLVAGDPTLHVELTEKGGPINVPSSVGLSLYRVVQEALTNVRKHAGPTQSVKVSVNVAYADTHVIVDIADDGRGASVATNAAGQGLIGMRERMALCGGSVHAGPRVGGGWLVSARAPVNGAPT
jgi:signal transduction histidine kinase